MPRHPLSFGERRETLLAGLVGALLVGLHYAIFVRFLPGARAAVGHDYALYMPNLLAGHFFAIRNGLQAVPWFTPALCGGIPFYANPNNLYVSLPQLLVLFTDFATAFRATFVTFAAVGFWGTYLLLRRVFALRMSAALLGAVIFLFNGFYSHRFIIGHIAFHSFMLVPLIAYLLARPLPIERGARRWRAALDTTLAGASFAYMFQSANVHGIAPAVIATACLGLLLSIGRPEPQPRRFWPRFAAAAVVAIALAAAKLAAAIAFLSSFPRSGYPLPGADGWLSALRLAARGLFLSAPEALATAVMVNVRWSIGREELEFGMTVVPAILLAAGAVALVLPSARPARQAIARAPGPALVLAVLLALPIAVNVHGAAWASVLKAVPLVANSVNLLRWWAAYIPVLAVLAAWSLHLVVRSRRAHALVAAVSMLAVVALHARVDRSFYEAPSYRTERIEAAQQAALAERKVVPIESVGVLTTADGRVVTPLERNDTMTAGISQILCYEPMFGYRQEWYPMKGLEPGPALRERNGVLNFKNPSCFLYPAANDCAPGDPFAVEDIERARAFLDYGVLPHRVPFAQRAARWLNLVAVAGMLLFLGAYLAKTVRGAMARAKAGLEPGEP